jgi:hypothetical protein
MCGAGRYGNDFMPFLLCCHCVRATCIKFSLRPYQVSTKTVVSSHCVVEDCDKFVVRCRRLQYDSITIFKFLIRLCHSHADTDKVGVRGKAVSSPETTVPYQLSQHYATVGPVFQQGDHYNSTSKEMWAYQRSSFRPLNFRNILYCLY